MNTYYCPDHGKRCEIPAKFTRVVVICGEPTGRGQKCKRRCVTTLVKVAA